MTEERFIHAIWCRFTPYLVTWAEDKYGTSLMLSGHRALELRPLPGVKDLLHEEVIDDIMLTADITNSASQLYYDALRAGSILQPPSTNEPRQHDDLDCFLPVCVPEYLLTMNGVMRPFSRVMQFSGHVASQLNKAVYCAFWSAIWDFAQTFPGGDRDMLETFCEETGIVNLHVDDLRNQFQRLKRTGYYLNES